MSLYVNTKEKSMDDILMSIREVIAEDMKEETMAPPSPSFSNIIELTQMVQDDGSIVDIKKPTIEAAPMLSDKNAPLERTSSETRQFPPSLTAVPQEVNTAEEPYYSEAPTDTSSLESLVSDRTVKESMEALSRLTSLSLDKKAVVDPVSSDTMGQRTLEDLMRDLLIPLLKNWLDANLPSLVKWIVTEEIQKILKQSENR